jgi:hypothetical protein
MKKILLAFDGTNFSEGVFEFVRKLNEAAPVLAVGVFLPQVDYANLWSYAAAASAGTGIPYIPLIEEEESETIQKNIEHFEELCQENGIAYRVHKDVFDFALPELKKESRFADVVILGGEIFYKGVPESTQFDYLRDALHSMESPVLIVPEHYHFPDNNVLAYDGSEESVYAMKQFAYIFPELAVNPTVLVWAESEDKEFPSRPQITELITQHYKDLTFYKLDFIPKRFFSIWLNSKKASILISGSFSRSTISQLFKRSFIKEVIINHQVPVFIAHK